ncbi:hypothetical protein [Sinomicrobium sp. M5D2P17]
MLFKNVHLEGIRSGKVTLAFRKWKKPAVKSGTILKTAVGQVEITGISPINEEELTEDDALRSGFKDVPALKKELQKRPSGALYRINVRYHSPDPRMALREQTKLGNEAFRELREKLKRLDTYSKQGNWTLDILIAIQEFPKLKAADLALKTGKEKEWLKPNIRKLKNLGLTVSHNPGYTLSPLGAVFLQKYKEE